MVGEKFKKSTVNYQKFPRKSLLIGRGDFLKNVSYIQRKLHVFLSTDWGQVIWCWKLIAWRNYKYHKFLSRVRLGVAHKTSTIPAICTYLQQAETSQISINWTSSFRSQMGRRLDASSFTPRVVPRSPSCPTKSWVREVMNAPQSNVNTRKQI